MRLDGMGKFNREYTTLVESQMEHILIIKWRWNGLNIGIKGGVGNR